MPQLLIKKISFQTKLKQTNPSVWSCLIKILLNTNLSKENREDNLREWGSFLCDLWLSCWVSKWQAKKTPGEERILVSNAHINVAKKAVWSWIFGLTLEFPCFGEFKSLALMSCSYFCMVYFLFLLVTQYSKQHEMYILLHMENEFSNNSST